MTLYNEGYAFMESHSPRNGKKIFFMAAFLVVALLAGMAHPAMADQPTIRIGGSGGSATGSNGPWEITISPDEATNMLPDDTDHVFTVSLLHNGDPQGCWNKRINLTTTLGIFLESGQPTYIILTNETCMVTGTVSYNQTGDAVITAKKDQPPYVEIAAVKHWTGTPATPALAMAVDADPFMIEGESASFSIDVTNTGNVPLTSTAVTIEGIDATYIEGDENGNGLFDPAEEWRFSANPSIAWQLGTDITIDVQATAWYRTTPLTANASFTYTGLSIEKQITVPRFSDAYQGLPFTVSATKGSDPTVFGPFTIAVNDPAQIIVAADTWSFTEQSREAGEPYPGTFTPTVATLVYQPGDTPTLTFENTLQYLPLLMNIQLTEHSVELNLSAGEYSHSLYALATDQYGEPLPALDVTFAGEFHAVGHSFTITSTNGSGYASAMAGSSLPQEVIVHAFRDADQNTYRDDTEIGDSCTVRWTYVPVTTTLTVLGTADATNYLDQGGFDHTFVVTLTDQFGVPMEGVRVNYTVDYEAGTDIASNALTDGSGQVSISVSSQSPDVAHVTASAGEAEVSMTKTWTYDVFPTTITLVKTAEDVNGGILVVGDLIRYTLTVNNTGGYPAYDVVVGDDLPSDVTCVEVDGDPSGCADSHQWAVGEVEPAVPRFLIIDATINADAAGRSIINTGTVTAGNTPPVDPPQVCPDGSQPVDDTCSVTPVDPVVPLTTLIFTKSARDVNGGVLQVGDLIEYTLSVHNTGDRSADAVQVIDALPALLDCVDVNGNAAGCTDPIVWNIGEILPAGEAALTIRATILPEAVGQSVINTGFIEGQNFTPVDPPQVCPDGSVPVEGTCPVLPINPEVPPTTTLVPPTPEPTTVPTGRSHGSGGSFFVSPPLTSNSADQTVVCGEDAFYVEGKGCVSCEPDEFFVQDQGCAKKNITPPLEVVAPQVPSEGMLARIMTVLANSYLILALLALLAVLVAIWWREHQRNKEIPPSPGGGGFVAIKGMERAYSSVINLLNEIDLQLRELERTLGGAAAISPQQAARVTEKFFYTAQMVEARIKDPEVRQHLSEEQIVRLNAQLKASVQKMVGISRQSENLLTAIQQQYAAAMG